MRKNMGLYRGKRKDNGEWIYGSFFYDDDVVTIFPNPMCIGCGFGGWWIDDGFDPVDPETVGQYTGKAARNGANVFEGDIVKAQVIQNTGREVRKYTATFVVAYHPEYCYFYLKREGNNLLFDGNWAYGVFIEEVVGNIHDNPELLEVSK